MRATRWIVFCLSVVAANAQERREPLRGAVVADAAGTPWSGATVRFLSRPLPGDERLGRADEVTARSDAKGRVLVQLLPGRFYLAWALERLADGRVRTSWPVEDVIAGLPLELVADAPRVPKSVHLVGLAAWQALGKVVVTAMSATSPAEVIALEPDGETLRLPPLPGRRARLQVTGGGAPLFQWARTVELATEEAERLVLQAPRQVRLRVVDGIGKPVAGATLALASDEFVGAERTFEQVLGVTDAAGDAVITLPLGPQPFRWVNYNFCVSAPGFAPVRNVSRFDVAADHDASVGEPAMTLQMPAGITHSVRCRCGDLPFAATVVVRTRFSSIGFDVLGATSHLTATDAEGRLTLQRRPGASVLLLAATADLPVRADVVGTVHPVALIGVAADGARPDLTFDVARLRACTLSVVDAAGTPVEAAHLAVVCGDGDTAELALHSIGTGRDGRATVLVPADFDGKVAAWTANGWAVQPLTAGKANAAIALRLAPAKTVKGKVLGKDGAPVAFASVVAHVQEGKDDTVVLAKAMGTVAATTARDGTFRLPLYPGVRYSLRVTTADDEKFVPDWTVGVDEPTELEIELAK